MSLKSIYMIQISDDPEFIRECQNKLKYAIKNSFAASSINIGWRGGDKSDFESYINPDLDIWCAFAIHKNKYWNNFGIGVPKSIGNNVATVEVNISFSGSSHIQGAFGKDDRRIYLLHRGRLGGNAIGRQDFFAWYRGSIISKSENNEQRKFAMVGELTSPDFTRQLATFVKAVGSGRG